MCGIAGIFAYHPDAPAPDSEEAQRMLDAMAARGPDGEGRWMDPEGRIRLGHRRLAVLDPSDAGAQPMLGENGRLALTFNGEIYNFRALKKGLEARGHRFRTASDSEVLLALWSEYGVDMVHHLRGMYAFALWDAREQTLFLARDPFGIKPLYYADDGRVLRFASQVKALMAGGHISTSPDLAAWAGFYLLGYVPEPNTIHKAVRALPAGSALLVQRDGFSRHITHFDLTQELRDAESAALHLSPLESQARLHEALTKSVRGHLVSDVPVGLFLSAGLDSTTLAALAADASTGRMKSITLGFHEFEGTPDDEAPLASLVAQNLGMDHAVRWITQKDFSAHFDHALAAMDQPSIDGINTYFVSWAARQAGMKVALSGLGGDELLGGYPGFRQVPRMARALKPFARFRIGKTARQAMSFLLPSRVSPKWAGVLEYGSDVPGAYFLRRSLFMPWELRALLDTEDAAWAYEELDLTARLAATVTGLRTDRARLMALEMKWYMSGQLLKDSDWASMAHGVEIRTPMVDLDLFRALAPVQAGPAPLGKRDLIPVPRKRLPEPILRRSKTGFTTPLRTWAGAHAQGMRGLRGWAQTVAGSQGSPGSQKILIFRQGSLGDTLVALPCFHLIAKAFPDAQRIVVTHAPHPGKAAPLASILENSGLIHGCIEYGRDSSLLRTFLDARRQIRHTGSDTLLYLAPTRAPWQVLRDRAFFRLCGIRRIIGIPSLADLKEPCPRKAGPLFESEARRLLRCLAPLGAADPADRAMQDLRLTAFEKQAARSALAALDPERPTLALSLGTKQPANAWGQANWTALMHRLHPSSQRWNLLLLGAAEEREASQEVALGWPGSVVNLCGSLTPRESAAALKGATLFLGHDSGPLHLAASVGVPCVGIFSARNLPGVWFPQGEGHEVIYHPVPCAGCRLQICTRNEHRCMTTIQVEEVLEAIGRVRERGNPRP